MAAYFKTVEEKIQFLQENFQTARAFHARIAALKRKIQSCDRGLDISGQFATLLLTTLSTVIPTLATADVTLSKQAQQIIGFTSAGIGGTVSVISAILKVIKDTATSDLDKLLELNTYLESLSREDIRLIWPPNTTDEYLLTCEQDIFKWTVSVQHWLIAAKAWHAAPVGADQEPHAATATASLAEAQRLLEVIKAVHGNFAAGEDSWKPIARFFSEMADEWTNIAQQWEDGDGDLALCTRAEGILNLIKQRPQQKIEKALYTAKPPKTWKERFADGCCSFFTCGLYNCCIPKEADTKKKITTAICSVLTFGLYGCCEGDDSARVLDAELPFSAPVARAV